MGNGYQSMPIAPTQKNSDRIGPINTPNLKKIFRYLVVPAILFLSIPCSAAPIGEPLARLVADNFLTHLNSSHLISSIEALNSASGQQVGFLVTLSPQGYIIVGGDDIRVPIKGYSLTSSFSSLPGVYTTNVLSELEVSPTQAKSTTAPQTENSSFWDYLKQSPSISLRTAYVPDTYLLTTQWGQGYPYNKFTPLSGGENTLTGCVQTALAQMLRYHKHPASGSGVFEHTWSGQNLIAIMARPFNWDIMPDDAAASPLSYQQDEVAALMIDIGILNGADFGLDGTSAGFDTVRFRRAFGYGPIYSKGIADSTFFDTIRSEIDYLRPVVLNMPNHLTIADGYASDQTGKKIHVNMGWEGAYDNYYYLDQTIVTGGNSFPPNHSIYYNISPCAGAECQPYPPAAGGQAPEFIQPLDDIAIRGTTKVRIDARDPDGDPVALSASSSCSSLQSVFAGNILTLTPGSSNAYCQVTVFARSQDGTNAETFHVLSGDENTYMGDDFDIAGQFSSQAEVDEFSVFLGNATTISGSRGYSNQAFYLWVKDQAGNTVVPATDDPVSATFTPGYYTVAVSLTSPTGWSYTYQPDYSSYLLSIKMDYTVAELAADLGLTMPMCQLAIAKGSDGNGTVRSQPSGIDCGASCSQNLVCNSEVNLSAAAGSTSLFTGWSGAGNCSGTASSIQVTVGGNQSCTANFALDADRDGMPDSWENLYGLNPSIDDSHLDADGDGIDNITEYRNGTPPVILPGDLNGDDTVNLVDAVLGLRVIAGEEISGIRKAADVNADGKIGLPEVVFCLQEISGL